MYFARFWIGFALSRQIRSWSFLRANDVPKYMGDSPPRYFKHVLTAVDRLNIDMTLLPDYKVRTFYEKLAHPSPRSLPCTGAWERRLATPLPWPNIWSNIYSGLSTNWEADIVWRLAHGVVKTRAYLKRWQTAQSERSLRYLSQTRNLFPRLLRMHAGTHCVGMGFRPYQSILFATFRFLAVLSFLQTRPSLRGPTC